MVIFEDPSEMQAKALELKRQGWRVGCVPTMGCLHQGHLSLMGLAARQADCVISTLFVNPLQFGAGEDFDLYPRSFERDCALAEEAGTDILFAPDAASLYAADRSVTVCEDTLSQSYEGAHRPGHFDGVLTVVAKLFNLTMADLAVFGQKDAQQLALIRRMARDLNWPIVIEAGPIVREPDGLAMSSRNVYLSPEHRAQAVWLHRSLEQAQQMRRNGICSAEVIRNEVERILQENTEGLIDYIALVDPDSFESRDELVRPTLAVMTVRFGQTRLLDNRLLYP